MQKIPAPKKSAVAYSKLALFQKLRKKKVIFETKIISNIKKFQIITNKRDYNKKYRKHYKENTFIEGNDEVNDWMYCSDDEKLKHFAGKKLHSEYPIKKELFLYFTEHWADAKEKFLRNQLVTDENGNIKKEKLKLKYISALPFKLLSRNLIKYNFISHLFLS